MDILKAAEIGLIRRTKQVATGVGIASVLGTLLWSIFAPKCELE